MAALPNLFQLSDTDLLARLCSEDEDIDLYHEFVKRLLPELLAECERICRRRKLNQYIGTQIAHECFEKVRKYKSFKIDQVKITPSRKAILAYLYRICVNLFNDHQRSEERKQSTVLNKTYFDNLLEDTSHEQNPEKIHKLKERTLNVFKKLTPREQRVIITDLEYKRSHKYLPDDVNESLATELKVKKDTIRKIRERAIQKLKAAINEAEAV